MTIIITQNTLATFQNKYRIASARAQWWDYGCNGAYFITICTQNRKHYFGCIKNRKMVLSPLGIIAENLWHEIPSHDPFVDLGEFVVMPKHIHGILILNKPMGCNNDIAVTGGWGRDVACNVSTPTPTTTTTTNVRTTTR